MKKLSWWSCEQAQSFLVECNKFTKECKCFAKERKVSQGIAILLQDSTKVCLLPSYIFFPSPCLLRESVQNAKANILNRLGTDIDSSFDSV